MAELPPEISTALVHMDAPLSFIGEPGRLHVEILPSVSLVWAATGTPVVNFEDMMDLADGQALEIQLPHTDQDGFLDGAGNTITGWYYTVKITYEKDGQLRVFPERDFQVLVGQAEVDLALVPAGEAAEPMVAPVLTVTSIDGFTGPVSLEELGLHLVDNTPDASKPISTATQAALDLKAPKANPTFTGTVTGVTKSMVGLSAVDNTSDAAKPISTLTQAALDAKLSAASLEVFGINKQSQLLGEAMRDLRKGNPVKIVIRGDSTTYGHDTVSSDKVAAPTGTLPDGTTHSFTRSPKPYPAALQDYLNLGRGVSNVTVENQGYSGDWVKRGYERWLDNVGADITVISYGINDASASYVPEDIRGDIGDYVDWTERMIQRDLTWGSAVVLLTPTRQQGQAGNMDTDSYRNALQSLALKYGIPLIDGEQFMATSPRDAWSDGNHLTTKGNAIMGARLAAVFFAENPLSPTVVDDGSKLLTRPTLDGFTKTGTSTYSSSPGYPTPQDNGVGTGSAIAVDPTGSVLWSFYAETPDLVVFPSAYIAGAAGETGASLTYTLDFGVDAGDNLNDRAVDTGAPVFASAASTVTQGPVVGTAVQSHATIKDAAPVTLRIPTPGWHTIRVTAARSASSSLFVHNLAFYSYQSYDNTRNTLTASSNSSAALAASAVKGSYLKADPASFNETTNADILNTKVPWDAVVAAVYGHTFNADYYKHPPMRLTVTSYNGAVMEYLLLATVRSDIAQADVAAFAVDAPTSSGSSKINILKLIRTTQLHTSAPGLNVDARVLESISFVGATKELQLNWKATLDNGTTPRNMKKNFNIAFTPV